MKNNKFVIVTGSCMFLLLMMIIFNIGGETKTTYSATTSYCENSSYVLVNENKNCCPSDKNNYVNGYCCASPGATKINEVDGAKYCGNDAILQMGGAEEAKAAKENVSSPSSEPSSSNSSPSSPSSSNNSSGTCSHGVYSSTEHCSACDKGYYRVESTGVGSNFQTEYICEKCDKAGAGMACPGGTDAPINCSETGKIPNADQTACVDASTPSKITPTISASLSKTSGVKGTTGTINVTVTDVATCPGTISIRNSYGMEINGKSTFETKSITSNGPHSFNFKVIGEGGKKGSILVSYTPNDTNKCMQPNNAFAEFTINISETDTRTQSTLTIANKSGVASMAKGDSSYLLIGANTTGMLYVSVGDSTVASFTFDEGNSAIEELRVSERATIKALKVGETTINIEFVPSDTTKYTNASASVPVKVIAGTSDGYACYECKNKNGTIDREWQKDTSSLGTCSEDTWVKLTTSYNECTDVQGMCYRCNNSGVYKWSVTTLSGVANANDKECASGWAFIKYTNDSDECKASSNPSSKPTGGSDDTSYPDPTPNPSSSNSNNATSNPQTGNIMLFVVWVIGFAVLGYSFWYFKNLNRNGA